MKTFILTFLLFVTTVVADVIVVDKTPLKVLRIEGRLIKSGSTWRLEFNNQTLQKVLGYPTENKKIVLFIPVKK